MSDGPVDNSLYELLPAIFRMRDAEQGGPLKALLEAIAVNADEVAQDIARVYDNWFIETCDDDLVPYFAGLVGVDLGPSRQSTADAAVAGVDAVWRRRQVANAIADRRRKGTFSVLEQLAADATGWPARAIELSRMVLATQSVKLPDVGRRTLLDIADADALALPGTPLSAAAPLPDVRRSSSQRTPGTANPGSVTVWLWRLVADQVQRAPAAPDDDDGRYTFDQLGRHLRLAVRPPQNVTSPPSTELDVATPITRRALAERLEDFYGSGRSICVYRGRKPVPRSEILVTDLGRRRARTRPGHVSIDPELGRIAFDPRHSPEEGVYVTYSRLGIGGLGGGDYARPLLAAPRVFRVGERSADAYRTVAAALEAWREASGKEPVPSATIEIADDGVYEERFAIDLVAGERLEIRAAQGRRPVLIPLASAGNRPDRLRVRGRRSERHAQESSESQPAEPHPRPAPGEPHPRPAPGEPHPRPAPVLVLDGIWIARHALELDGQFAAVEIRHCTLVPPGALPRAEDRHAASIVVRAMPCPISIVSSVLGRIRVESREVGRDPIPLSIADSVIDASEPGGWAVLGADERPAWASLSLERVTVLGGAHVHAVDVVEDSILTDPLDCERRQQGTVRYSFIARGSRTPRRSRCQPDDGMAAAEAAAAGLPPRERELVGLRALHRLSPHFDSVVFGDPAYARLAPDAAPELVQGAQDQGELGAYHNLWQALRVADLTARLREFTPAGAEIDIRFAS
ncbi:MAG: hypothetical protein JOY89_14005 [Solirubrobacterales bacterium]|nr:hypothetical protein [Solirubrobacterales bacterium]